MEQEQKLFEAEYKLVQIVWEQEPIGSGELAKRCQDAFGWRRTTTYTVLKRLCDRQVLRNQSAMVTALVKRSEIQRQESQRLMDRLFDNSLPGFLAAFMEGSSIDAAEADQLKKLIDRYRREEQK